MHALTPRPARPADAFQAALLLASTQEPHFHPTTANLAQSIQDRPSDYVVTETPAGLSSVGTFWLPDFHPTHAWVGLHLHPDHRADDTAPALMTYLSAQARATGRNQLWTSVREDYLSTWPDLSALGFREVHRTFGGGFHLKDWKADTGRLNDELTAQGLTFTPAADHRTDPRLHDLYALTRAEKVTALPTIPAPGDALTDDDALWDAAWLAWRGETLLGIALPERARLEAWNAVLVVHPDVRRRGVATALLTRVARSLQDQGVTFLNTAGSGRDAAYLGILRRLGANIEPDWIAWEREA